MKIVPTLGDLRKSFRDEGMPPPHTEYTYDLETEGAPGYLPDCLVVSRRMCELARAGAYDRYPDDTPLEELERPAATAAAARSATAPSASTDTRREKSSA